MSAEQTPRRSLRTRLTVALLAAGVLPLLSLGLLVQPILHHGLAHTERLLQSTTLEHVDALLESTLDRVAETTHQVGAVLAGAGAADAKIEQARERVARVPILRGIEVFGPTGAWVDAIERRGPGSSRRPRSLDGQHLDCEAGVAGAWTFEPGTSAPVVQYAEALADAHGDCVAWLVATIDEAALADRVSAVSRSVFDRADAIWVLDAHDRVVLPRPDADAARDLEAVRRDLPEALGRLSGTYTAETNVPGGVPIVASIRRVEARGWTVAVRRDQRAAYATIVGIRRGLFAAAAAIGLVALLVAGGIARRITRPIGELVRVVRAYGRREFEVRPQVATGDELEALGAAMATMADGLAASEREITRRAIVEESFARYVPKELATAIAEGRASLELGGRRRALTALFADLASFTPFAEAAPPEKVVAFLNELFTIASEVVFRHGGTIDKFIGDGFLALFGALSDDEAHARRAVAAAEDLQRFVAASAAAWWEGYGVRAELAIGVATGDAIVGNLGSAVRMEFTAIGDMVNVAARLETLARPGQTLVTRAVVDAVGEAFLFAPLGAYPLHGKQAPLEVYELR